MTSVINEELAGPVISPIPLTERLPSLDVLRGFALLGILPANMMGFAGPPPFMHSVPVDIIRPMPHHTWDIIYFFFEWTFIESKMRPLFAALFGAGTIVLLSRVGSRAGSAVAADIFHRRTMWLACFGLLHAIFIWPGDILFVYGIVALLTLYPLRNAPPKRLIASGLFIAIVLGSIGLANLVKFREELPEALLQSRGTTAVRAHLATTPAETAELGHLRELRKKTLSAISSNKKVPTDSYWDMIAKNARDFSASSARYFGTGFFFEIVGFMILGMGLFRIGFFSGRLSSRTYLVLTAVGSTTYIPLVLLGLLQSSTLGFSQPAIVTWLYPTVELGGAAAMLANASLIMLAIRYRIGVPIQRGLAAVGRMAFTNYITMSLICQLIFQWGPWQLYGKIEFYQQAFITLAVWAVNVAGSLVWLKFFGFGPLEWVWRSLTYWQMQPLRARSDATGL